MKKIKTIGIISATALLFVNCSSSTENKTNDKIANNVQKVEQTSDFDSTAYTLMQQKCFICHMEKPDPSKKGQMLAPPMMRIKAHYKPSFADKESFVKAVTDFVINPTDQAILMPGAARKFNIMPNLNYNKEEVEKIANLLYDMDFGDFPAGMHKQKMNPDSMKLSLNNGKKWKIKPDGIAKINEISEKLANINSDNIEDYNQLGKETFDVAKFFLLDKDYQDKELQQLKFFFHDTEDKIHKLISTKDLNEARKIVSDLKADFDNFKNYFSE